MTGRDEHPVRSIQCRSVRLGQMAASTHRMKHGRLKEHKIFSFHRDRDLIILETSGRCGGQTWKIGEDHDADPSEKRWHESSLLILKIHVYANLMFVEPQSDLVHRLRASTFHFYSFRMHLRNKTLLAPKIRGQIRKLLVLLLVPKLILKGLNHNVKVISAPPNVN